MYLDGRPIKTLGGFSGDENTLFRVDLNKNQYRKLSKVKLRVDRHTAQMERENFSLVTKSDSDGPGSVPMSSTLEIIHKYHIISAQISAWEKPF